MTKIRIDKKQKKLIENEVVALATSDLNRKPNVVAITSQQVVGENKILITDNFMTKTRKNLLKNNQIAIAVWNKEGTEGYQFRGKAQYLNSGVWKKKIDEDPENKDYPRKAAVLVTVDEIWDLAEPKLVAEKKLSSQSSLVLIKILAKN